MAKALLVIDLQNDYFPEGKFPLWNAEGTLRNVENAIRKANEGGVPVILVQHIAAGGPSPFFNAGTAGVNIHPSVLAAAPKAPVIVKHFADAFLKTELEKTLMQHGTTELLICGMMTQNCVTHTAISKSAESFNVSVLADCCTTVTEMIHNIALNALSARVRVVPSGDA